jgi:hypothetical protein
MPHIVITEADFEKLSRNTQDELILFIHDTLFALQGSSSALLNSTIETTEPNDALKLHNAEQSIKSAWVTERQRARKQAGLYNDNLEIDLAHDGGLKKGWLIKHARSLEETNSTKGDYDEYLRVLGNLQAHLPKVINITSSIHFEKLSVEMAIAVLSGLGEDSLKVIKYLLKYRHSMHKHYRTRSKIASVVNGAAKLNGTIGSINRRLVNRLDTSLYSSQLDRVKLIDYSNKHYYLTCRHEEIYLALKILEAGYEIGMGDIFLGYAFPSHDWQEKFLKERASIIKIEEEAIIFADKGKAFAREIEFEYEDSWETEDKDYHQVQYSRNFSVLATTPSAKILDSADDGGWVMVNDEEKILIDPHSFTSDVPAEIVFNKVPQQFKGEENDN